MKTLYLNKINNNISFITISISLTITKKHSSPGGRGTPTDLKLPRGCFQLALINIVQQAFKERRTNQLYNCAVDLHKCNSFELTLSRIHPF